MSWLLVYLMALAYPFLIGLLLWKLRPWRWALLSSAIVLLPAVVFMWPYFKIKNEHERLCALDGGLRILKQPDRADSVRIYLSKYEALDQWEADLYIRSYAPKLRYLELHLSEEKEQDELRKPVEKRKPVSWVYTYQPNPRYKELPPNVRNGSSRYMAVPVPDMPSLQGVVYEFKEKEEKIPNGVRTVMELSRNGEVYARSIYYRHIWSGIKYPDAVEDFRCPANRYGAPDIHVGDLIKVIFN